MQREKPNASLSHFIEITEQRLIQNLIKCEYPYKHTTSIPRSNDGRFHVVSTWNTRGVFVGILTYFHRKKFFFLIFKKVLYHYLEFSSILLKLSTSVFFGSGFHLTYSRGVFVTKDSRMDQQTISLQLFKGCLPQILLVPFLNTQAHLKPCQTSTMELCILDVCQGTEYTFVSF